MNTRHLFKRAWHRWADDHGASGGEYAIAILLITRVQKWFSGPVSTAVSGRVLDICNAAGGTDRPTA